MSWAFWLNRIGRGGLEVVVLMAVIMWGRTEDRASWRRRWQYSFEPWGTMRYFGLVAGPPGAETLISEAPTWHKKRGRLSVPFQGSRGRGKNRLLHSSVSPQIQNFGRTQDRQYGWTWR